MFYFLFFVFVFLAGNWKKITIVSEILQLLLYAVSISVYDWSSSAQFLFFVSLSNIVLFIFLSIHCSVINLLAFVGLVTCSFHLPLCMYTVSNSSTLFTHYLSEMLRIDSKYKCTRCFSLSFPLKCYYFYMFCPWYYSYPCLDPVICEYFFSLCNWEYSPVLTCHMYLILHISLFVFHF